jgi:hypothetical protein
MYTKFLSENLKERPLGRPRRKWEDNIKMDLRERKVGNCGLDSCGSRGGPVAGSCERDNEPWGFVKGGEFLD